MPTAEFREDEMDYTLFFVVVFVSVVTVIYWMVANKNYEMHIKNLNLNEWEDDICVLCKMCYSHRYWVTERQRKCFFVCFKHNISTNDFSVFLYILCNFQCAHIQSHIKLLLCFCFSILFFIYIKKWRKKDIDIDIDIFKYIIYSFR